MGRLREGLLNGLFPPRCPACLHWTAHPGLCRACVDAVGYVRSPLCPACGVPFPSSHTDHRCGRCLMQPPPFDRLRSCATYGQGKGATGPLAIVLHRYKYGRDVSLAKTLGDFLATHCPLTIDHDVLVPVPLHVSRLRWRGFNQSLLLAQPLAKRTDIRVDPFALQRTRATQPQVELGERDRRGNIAGAFTVRHPTAVRGRSILLVDDVYTSGATAHECARNLRQAGAHAVDVLVLVRAT